LCNFHLYVIWLSSITCSLCPLWCVASRLSGEAITIPLEWLWFWGQIILTKTVCCKCVWWWQSIKEDKEKKIRGQEAEQKKLRSDVDELCTSFNTEMANLFQQRLVV
jgi:hypothetical protein